MAEYIDIKCYFCDKDLTIEIFKNGEVLCEMPVLKKHIIKSYGEGRYFCDIGCLRKNQKEIEKKKIDYIEKNKFTRFEIMDI